VALPEIATTKLLDAWQHAEILRRTVRLYALDIHNAHAHRIAHIFARAARSCCTDAPSRNSPTAREQQLPAARAAFAPVRALRLGFFRALTCVPVL